MPRLTRALLSRVIVPTLLLASLALVAGTAGYFSVGGSTDSQANPAQDRQSPFVRGVIQSLTTDRLVISTESGPIELRIASNAPVEALRPITIERLAAGDWLNGGALPHAQTLFALVGLVVIPPSQLESPR